LIYLNSTNTESNRSYATLANSRGDSIKSGKASKISSFTILSHNVLNSEGSKKFEDVLF